MSLSVQLFSLLAMVATGIVAASFIDMIGTGISHSGRVSFVRRYSVVIEVISWVLVGCGAFIILYIVRDGAWRIYDPLAQISGLLLYVSFIHRPFRVFGRIVFLLFVKPVMFLFLGVFSIIKYVFVFIGRLFDFLLRPFVEIFRKYFRKYFKNKSK